MPTEPLLECQALHRAAEEALRGCGPTQHRSILSRQRGIQDPGIGWGPRSPLLHARGHPQPRWPCGAAPASSRRPVHAAAAAPPAAPAGPLQQPRSAPRTAAGPGPPASPAAAPAPRAAAAPFRMSSSLSGS